MWTTSPVSSSMTLFCASRPARPAANSSSMNSGSPSASPAFTLSISDPCDTSCPPCRANVLATSVVREASLAAEMVPKDAPPSPSAPSPSISDRGRLREPSALPPAGGAPEAEDAASRMLGSSSSRAMSISRCACSTSSSSTSSLRSFSFACAVARRMRASSVRVVTASRGFLLSDSCSSAKPLWYFIRSSTYLFATIAWACWLSTGFRRLQ
mmetsp:Transcript_45025/g.127364  ORF Transcript_45025/g.127364 Transcript_45025/m.127364 type:complete len:212 (+) Transcript_45025:451-1086(+)